MGMYVTINDQQIKFSGKLAQAISDVGIDCTDSIIVIERDKLTDVLIQMAHLIDTHSLLVNGLFYPDVVNFANDAHKLAVLYDWSNMNDTGELVFV